MDLNQNLIIARAIKPDAHAVGAVNGAAIDLKNARNAVLIIDVADKGAAGTADVVVTDCETSGGTYATHTTVAQITANGQTIVELSKLKRYVKVNLTVGANAIDASAVIVGGNLRESKNLIS